MPLAQSNLPRKVQEVEEYLANQWYTQLSQENAPFFRFNDYPTACPMGCKVGKWGTCAHGYRSFQAIVAMLNGRG